MWPVHIYTLTRYREWTEISGFYGFLAKLQMALQSDIHHKPTTSLTPNELGVDSLIAVDLQS